MASDDNEERSLKKLTVRELRTRAVKSLGSKVAAGLKLKDELIAALAGRAAKVVAPKKSAPRPAKASAPRPTKSPPRATKAAAKAPSKSGPKAPEKSAPRPAAKSAPRAPRASAKRAAASEPISTAVTPPRPPAKPQPKVAVQRFIKPRQSVAAVTAPRAPAKAAAKTDRVMQVYELPITRDFFVDPRKPTLPPSYGDDRLLCFRREPLAIVVSWDLSAASFGDGQGLTLELITGRGRFVSSVPITTPTGLATFETLPEGTPLTVQAVRRGRVLARAQPFMLGDERPETDEPQQMTIAPDQALPQSPAREQWRGETPEAAALAANAGPAHASSSRLTGPARPSSNRLSS
ncbi:MAG: hypothetical protein IPJ65_42615 [Archangiaceae bacterium]|nr:hypothetical protein [Archangiaceae bacterium]